MESDQQVMDAMFGGNDWYDARILVEDNESDYADVWLKFQWHWGIPFFGRTIEECVANTQEYLDRVWAAEDNGEQLAEPLPIWLSAPITDAWPVGMTNESAIEVLDPDRNRVFEPVVTIRNGRELIQCDSIEFDGELVRLHFDHYDSYIEASIDLLREKGDPLQDGKWVKERGSKGRAELQLTSGVRPGPKLGWHPDGFPLGKEFISSLNGTWSVQFDQSGDAVGEFEILDHGGRGFSPIFATFRTPTGDFRYIAGWIDAVDVYTRRPKIHMSAFDGAHAFHFTADLLEDGSLTGDFWSGNWHHETWTAERIEP